MRCVCRWVVVHVQTAMFRQRSAIVMWCIISSLAFFETCVNRPRACTRSALCAGEKISTNCMAKETLHIIEDYWHGFKVLWKKVGSHRRIVVQSAPDPETRPNRRRLTSSTLCFIVFINDCFIEWTSQCDQILEPLQQLENIKHNISSWRFFAVLLFSLWPLWSSTLLINQFLPTTLVVQVEQSVRCVFVCLCVCVSGQ